MSETKGGGKRPTSGSWRAREVSYAGIFVAAMLALGYALAPVPNVELVSLIAFLSGWLLGPAKGALTGGAGILLFSLLNPYGPPLPPVLAAQVSGMAVVAASGGGLARLGRGGGWWRRSLVGNGGHPYRAVLLLGTAGAILTLLYDAVTNAGHALAMGLAGSMLKVIAAGLSFALLHIIANTTVFAILGPISVRLIEGHLGGRPHDSLR